METSLYQFPVSHYCEKARWALDYKGVPYKTQTLLPGLHLNRLKKLVPDSTVPVLQINDTVIQGSNQIIDHLDILYPDKPLTPRDPAQVEEVAEWENFAANKIADPLRCFFYYYLLDYPKTLIPLFSQGGPWYGKYLLGIMFKQLRQRMQTGYHLNQRNAQLAMRVVDKAIKRLEEHLETHPFLVGTSFTRADLSVCALLSPLVMPERGYLKLNTLTAQPLLEYRMARVYSPVFRWVNTIYNNYR